MKIRPIVIFLLFFSSICNVRAELVPRLNSYNSLNIQKINPAFYGKDSIVIVSLGSGYQFVNYRNIMGSGLGFGKYEWDVSKPEINYEIGQRKYTNFHDIGVSIPIRLDSKLSLGIGVNSNMDFIDQWVNAYSLNIGFSAHYKINSGIFSLGAEMNSYQFNSNGNLKFNHFEDLPDLKLNQNFFNSGLGLAYTHKTGKFQAGIAIKNIMTMEVGVKGFMNNIHYGISNISNRTFMLNLRHHKKLFKDASLESTAIANIFDMSDLKKLNNVSLVAVAMYRNIGIGLNYLRYPDALLYDERVGPVLRYNSKNLTLQYSYSILPTKVIFYTDGFQELGVQYRMN